MIKFIERRTRHIEKNRRKIFCFISFPVKLLKKYYTCISIITLPETQFDNFKKFTLYMKTIY